MSRASVSSRGVSAVLALVFATTALPRASFADAYDAAMAKAIASKEKAVDSNEPSQWADALRLFEEADAVRSTKDSKYELANAAARLREDDVAFEAYEAAIALGLGGKPKEKAKAFLDENASKMGRVAVTGPVGASVSIGARGRGTLPRPPIVVFAGPVKVRLTHAGKTVDDTVTVAAGATVTVDLGAKLVEPAPAATVAATPASSAPPSSAVASPTVPIADTGAGARALGWSLVIGGGIVMVVGGVGAVLAGSSIESRRTSLASRCARQSDPDRCTEARDGEQGNAQSDVDAILTWKNVRTGSLISVGVGALVAGVGVVRLLTAPAPPRASAWRPQIYIGERSAFLGVDVTF